MNKRIIPTFLFLLIGAVFCLRCHAQIKGKSKVVESYKTFKQKSDQQSIDDLLTEANLVRNTNRSEALNNVKEALGMSLAQQDVLHEGQCYLLLGQINEDIEEWKLALENFTEAYEKLKERYPNTPELYQALFGMGNALLKLGEYQKSLLSFQEASTIQIKSKEPGELQLNISEVYYQMGNYTDALKVLDETGRQSKKMPIDILSSKIQNQKAKIYARLNQLDKAQGLYENSIRANKGQIANKPGTVKDDEVSLRSTKEEISDALVEQKRYDDEINLRNQSIAYNEESKNFSEVSKDKVKLSEALVAKGETSEAIKELEEAAGIADTINDPKEQAKAFLALAGLYQKNNRIDQALVSYKKYSEAVAKSEKENHTHLTEKSELIKQQKDIEELSKYVTLGQRDETIAKGTVFRQQLLIYGLLAIIILILITSYFIYKNAKASKIANQLLALKSLRSQMNPHFIFNALNSVNHFVAQQDERTANKFLSEFSQLMRLVLENSQEDFIPLHKESEILSLYLKLEHYRFRDKFDYEIKIDENIDAEAFMLPPMLIQPYIENAVWHGLRYKESKGHLTLKIYQDESNLVVEITDNGIGRKRSAALKTENQKKHQSTGLKNIEERLKIINKVYKSHYYVSVTDLDTTHRTGTHVRILLPMH